MPHHRLSVIITAESAFFDMDRNTFIAIGVSLAILLLYYAFFAPKPVPQTIEVAKLAEDITLPTDRILTKSELKLPLIVETPYYRATFNLDGGILHSFALKQYRIDKRSVSWGRLLPFKQASKDVDETSLVEMIDERFPGKAPFALLLNQDQTLTNLRYNSNQAKLLLQAGDNPRSITLRAKTSKGIRIAKTFTFAPDSYIIDYQLEIKNSSLGEQQVSALSILGTAPPSTQVIKGFGNHTGPLWWLDDDLKKEDPDDLDDGLVISATEWGGSASAYFINAALVESGSNRLFFGGLRTPKKSPWQSFYGFELPNTIVSTSNALQHKTRVYIGPKDLKQMRLFHHKFELAKDLTLSFIAEPMLVALRAFQRLIGNYGWSIILLTVCIRIVLFPLTYMGSRSMKRVRMIQPKLKAIKIKFKGKKDKINQETFQLYRKHKINPLGGCLPILAQIPIFFAFYSALLSAIELRHQPFIFWIQDLSAKDSLYILPVLMSASMFLQQKVMPPPADPTQQKIMAWLPVFFLFFMFNFPSGLVLYWFVSNLLSIAQQLVVDRITPDPV